jgi:hypothetical protein
MHLWQPARHCNSKLGLSYKVVFFSKLFGAISATKIACVLILEAEQADVSKYRT